MCAKEVPAFLRRFVYVLQFFGIITFNKHLKVSCAQRTYLILRILCQWSLLLISAYNIYTFFLFRMSAEEISVLALWCATLIHSLISTIVICRGQGAIMHMFSEMSGIIDSCVQKPSYTLCRFFELTIYILGATVLVLAYFVSTKSGMAMDALTQIINVNNVLMNFINILVEQIILMYIFFVSSVIRTISRQLPMENLRVGDVKGFRRIYRDLCMLTISANEHFGIVLTAGVTFSQLQCWVDMLLLIRKSLDFPSNDFAGIMFTVATVYHIFQTYLLCWFCEDIENQVRVKFVFHGASEILLTGV